MTEQPVLLRVETVSKVYPGIIALQDVSFDVVGGAVNVLVGENGAGKSTLMKVIAGVVQPTSGRMLMDGNEVQFNTRDEAIARGIGMVFQELNLFPNMSVAENIFIGREITRPGRGIDIREQERRAGDYLRQLEADIDPTGMVGDLPIGQQQIVEIAKALAQNARILIMDEPTSALSLAETTVLFRVIDELKARGVGIVYISHRLEELIRIGDFVTTLRDGRVTGGARMAEIDLPWIIRKMIGGEAKDFPKADGHRIGAEVFRAEEITLPSVSGGYKVDHVSLSVRKGEIVGIYGLMGAGRSEFFDCVMGRHTHSAGRIFIDGKLVRECHVSGRIRRGLALIPEDRQREGLVSILSIATNMTMASLARYTSLFHIRREREAAAVSATIRDLSIKAPYPDLPVSSMSGGNQQKVVIAKALMTSPKVLLMDEPSRGIDIGAKADVFRTMRRLAADGLGILFVTSDLEEVMALSDRIAVMSNGRVTRLFEPGEATEDAVVLASSVGHGTHSHSSPASVTP
ncbi:sugar ABC transporter ATP-binding protein [Lichenicola cladoniae]|uniref:Sugar ABC transporter ATP-binding protein n=1 Tax=Lichenicola cladoniae TaxID=1484109 RepID=A0A6M8HW09_9PROT|nr:sugar ABC transporter ATP-binding protein [Lichenicola cladoniae]NPD66662.1 sugar ABC transporter ATP-binding protein [Acetobacteraceae bacterium]QKE92291.1 sugar ABC transporter ATP-binding protein [Lichenicola cladoniae]